MSTTKVSYAVYVFVKFLKCKIIRLIIRRIFCNSIIIYLKINFILLQQQNQSSNVQSLIIRLTQLKQPNMCTKCHKAIFTMTNLRHIYARHYNTCPTLVCPNVVLTKIISQSVAHNNGPYNNSPEQNIKYWCICYRYTRPGESASHTYIRTAAERNEGA